MAFGSGIRTKLDSLAKRIINEHKLNITSEELVTFTEHIVDDTISKKLSYDILDAIAMENDGALSELIIKEYTMRNMVISLALREYPDLFNRRIYIPLRSSLYDMVISILASLRISNDEDVVLVLDGKSYSIAELAKLSMLELRGFSNITLVYGHDSWCFDIKIIGLTYVRLDEIDLPFIVEDAVGYGILGMAKSNLFAQLEDSKDLALDTKNPIMDDEEYEFYNADTDELNENSINEFNRLKEVYPYE